MLRFGCCNMNSVYSMEYPLRACDFDRYHRLQPAGVLDLFQDVAGRHALELGIGFPQLAPQNKMWIVSGLEYQVVETPVMYQQVRLVTWPLESTSVTCRRDYRMETLEGKLLVRGTSDWAMMDSQKRKLVRGRDIYPPELAFREELAIEGKMPRLRDFEPEGEGFTLIPGYSHLDMNGHVNNTKYAGFMLDALCLEEHQAIETFQIHYRKELMAYEPVTLYKKQENNTFLLMGKSPQGDTMFSGRIELKP